MTLSEGILTTHITDNEKMTWPLQ